MKLTISTLACPKWTLPQICEAAAAAGIEGLDFRGLGDEIDITRLPHFNEGLAETLAMLKLHNLQMPCLNTSITLVTPAPERWQMMLEEAQRNAVLAEKTRTKYLRVFGGAVPKEMSRAEAASLAHRHARQLIKICAGCGCMPVVETHDTWTFASQVLELLHEFDPSEIGVLWDVEHPYRSGEKPIDSYTGMKRFIRHVHFKDSVRVDNKNSPRLLGEGDLPLKEFVQILRDGGYDGWICQEMEKRWHAEAPEPEVSIPQFAAYMRSL